MDFNDLFSSFTGHTEPFKPGKLTDKEKFGKALLDLHKKITPIHDKKETK